MARTIIVKAIESLVEDEPVVLSARVNNLQGQRITQAALASIELTVTNGNREKTLDAVDVAIEDTVYDSLQGADESDLRWQEDDVGYNFQHVCPASAFPSPSNYLIEYWFTDNDGQRFRVAFAGPAAPTEAS